MPFLAHPALVADRTRAYRLDPRPEQAAPWRFGLVGPEPSRYVPVDEPLPQELAEAVREWPGPCAYYGRHCDSYAYAEPLRAAAPELAGLDFPPEGYAANAARRAELDAARADLVRREDVWRVAARGWYLRERDRLVAEAPRGPGWVAAQWLDGQAAQAPELTRESFGIPAEGWPYLADVEVQAPEGWYGYGHRVPRLTVCQDFSGRLAGRLAG